MEAVSLLVVGCDIDKLWIVDAKLEYGKSKRSRENLVEISTDRFCRSESDSKNCLAVTSVLPKPRERSKVSRCRAKSHPIRLSQNLQREIQYRRRLFSFAWTSRG